LQKRWSMWDAQRVLSDDKTPEDGCVAIRKSARSARAPGMMSPGSMKRCGREETLAAQRRVSFAAK
jgi:hypothetical protein